MAKVGDLKRLMAEDFPKENQDLINKLAYVLNPFMEKVVAAFNKGIDFTNLNQSQATFNITVDANGNPTQQTSIKYDLKTPLTGLYVILAQNQTDSTTVTGAPFITFTQAGTSLNITNVKGLPANKNFKISVILVG